MTTVTDADREAYLALNMLPPELAEAVQAGKWDHLTGMQVLARHREAAEERARLEGIAMGIKAAAREATSFLVGDPANGVPLHNPMAHEIADATRTLAPAAILAQHKRAKVMDSAADADLI